MPSIVKPGSFEVWYGPPFVQNGTCKITTSDAIH